MRRFAALLMFLGLAIGGFAIANRLFRARSADDLVELARAACGADRDDDAEALLRESLEVAPDHPPALLLAAKIAERRGRPVEALRYLRRLPDDVPRAASVFADAGSLALRVNRAADAEFFLQRAVRIDPLLVEAHRRLAALYVAEGRRWESEPHLWELVRLRRFTIEELALLGNLDDLYGAQEVLEAYRTSVPEDPTPLIGMARIALRRGRAEEAEDLFRQVVAVAPEQVEAQAGLGLSLAERGSEAGFVRWLARLPDRAYGHPGVWLAMGAAAAQRSDVRGATRCYGEAARRHPNSRVAAYQLSHLLAQRGETETAKAFAARSEQLDRLENLLRMILERGPDLSRLRSAAELTDGLGRPWEAWAWYTAITTRFPDETWAQQEVSRVEAALRPDTPRTLTSANLALGLDLATYPIPEWPDGKGSDGDDTLLGAAPEIRFVDCAADAGLNFTYENGAARSDGMMIFQAMGGGVGVIDYDGDGWPDLYLPQGGAWSRDPRRLVTGSIFRNRGDGGFADVTAATGISNVGYGFGVGVGDFDEDGWPDLYAATAGRNRLFRNNADGTFTDVTEAAGLFGEHWTSCGLIADLNGDSVADLFEVNYCAGSEPFERVCADDEPGGTPRTCKPTRFPPDPDRLFLGRGDGTFEDVTDRGGLSDADGRGLGIVAFDPDGTGRLSLFVANDMTANSWWLNVAEGGGAPEFDDRATSAGLAFDSGGQSQACMGVAADDADGDGLLDLFVTNFLDESNALYLQKEGGVFADEARKAGLFEPSLNMLGFGTQFIDADLDGRPDVVVANGHIDDYSRTGRPFRMRPQFFRNLGGRFDEYRGGQAGAYFEGERLGRGLARLDWDRDGREDFAVSHLFEPVSLVTNRSPNTGHSLAVRLRATSSSRDAIGATVTVVASQTLVKQLTAGDGYQASNERRLVFGLGTAVSVRELRIRWPSGHAESFHSLRADGEYLVVEGRGRLLSLARDGDGGF